MKKLIIVFVALVMALGVNAQQGAKKGKKTPEERIENKINKMKEVMAITSEQEAQIRPVLKAKQDAMIAFRKTHKGDKEAIKAERKKQKGIVKKQLKTILTPEQHKKWKEHKENQRAEKKQKAKSVDTDQED